MIVKHKVMENVLMKGSSIMNEKKSELLLGAISWNGGLLE